ncbi:type 1 glutamine amidotransferase domain-containing protein [Rhizobium sp. RM]|uniref:type 1 glutamine amidotransferase domain-containing protein n=1 Tax=Rhizobium sp. RM TaxID=2748079 RepID=UPI00110F54A6|nr:type 1 glutamine amidotransferase domain-containing protein [Rhizobium sp. RM]NWJ27647.1 type 1 glutamine amidotransferase domain-containing protein [Rhizobium sp. RM]TMV18917.1 type 1 glutamine amidotransferase domain-containing protein [Rhizobium sp. Td3]
MKSAPRHTKPVLFVLTSHSVKGETGEPTGFYLGEVTHPLAVLDAAGISAEFASIHGGEPPVDGLDLSDETNSRYWNSEDFRRAIRNTSRLSDIDPKNYSAIFFAGGHGAMWDFPTSSAVNTVARDIYEAGGIVAAVCHGPAALVNITLSSGVPLVAGKNVASFTDDEERAVKLDKVVPFLLASTLAACGAHHHPAPDWTANVVVDGRLVTGQNPQSATGVGEALRDLLIA